MLKYLLLCITVFSLSSCTHCSLTETVFEGKTKGMNPYGDGDVIIDRQSYWGTNACVVEMLKQKG